MPSCDAIDLIAYIEGEDPYRHVAQHIESCPRCRRDLQIYRRLLKGIVSSWPHERHPCPARQKTIEAALQVAQPPAAHLAQCRECSVLYATITGALGDIQEVSASSAQALPPRVLQKVADRKKQWLSTQAKKVLGFHPSKNQESETARLKRLLEETDDALPLAAFPDDLTGKDPDKDGET